MRIWCGLAADQLGTEKPDVIVFPEGVDHREINRAQQLCPSGVIAGAVLESGRMRGVIQHRSSNHIDYLKVGRDGYSAGGPPPSRPPIYAGGAIAIGLLICMDVQEPILTSNVVAGLHTARAPFKVLCIPAEMSAGSGWFPDTTLSDPRWAGIHVALCNNNVRYPEHRVRSFITDAARQKVVVQAEIEAIAQTF